jgi:hypothetical protein
MQQRDGDKSDDCKETATTATKARVRLLDTAL